MYCKKKGKQKENKKKYKMENKLKLKYVIALGDILWKYNESK